MTRRGRRMPERALVRRFQSPPRLVPTAALPLQELLKTARKEGVIPAHLYAIEKLGGKIITTDNAHTFSEADQQKWIAAVKEYQMPREKVAEIFHNTHERLRGADPMDIMSAAISYATGVALHLGMNNEQFMDIVKEVVFLTVERTKAR